MSVEIVADENCAAFIDSTTGEAFGPTVRFENLVGEDAHREVAREVLKQFEAADFGIKESWNRNPNIVHRKVSDLKLELYGEL